MPSPIAHWTVGLVVCRSLWPRAAGGSGGRPVPWRWLLLASLAFSLLPDAGSVVGVITGEFGRFHNSWEHSLAVGAGCALIGTALARAVGLAGSWRWGAMIFLCFELHVLMDLFTVGRGVRVLWPFVEDRYSPALKLFYGVHWSEGWLSPRHWVTLLSELAFAAVIAAFGYAWLRRRRRSRPAGRTAGRRTEAGP